MSDVTWIVTNMKKTGLDISSGWITRINTVIGDTQSKHRNETKAKTALLIRCHFHTQVMV